MPYRSDGRRKYSIKFHIIFVVKYRKKLLAREDIGCFVKQSVEKIAETSDFSIEVMEVDKDQLHMLVSTTPMISAFQIVRKLKQQTTFEVWKNYGDILSKHFWKEKTFWTDGYFVSSIGEVSEATVRKYIEEQG